MSHRLQSHEGERSRRDSDAELPEELQAIVGIHRNAQRRGDLAAVNVSRASRGLEPPPQPKINSCFRLAILAYGETVEGHVPKLFNPSSAGHFSLRLPVKYSKPRLLYFEVVAPPVDVFSAGRKSKQV